MKKARLLIVSYWFPPAGGIPVQRALSLARYLPECGIEVHVLAPKNPPAPQSDPALLGLIPKEVTVHRAFTPMPPSGLRQKLWKIISPGVKPSANPGVAVQATPARAGWKGNLSGLVRRMLAPDPEVVWTPFARRKARWIVKKYGIDTVMVTAPPFSSFLVTNALKREFPHLNLISDFRDDWLRFFLTTFDFQKSEQIRQQAVRIERETVEQSSRVVVVTRLLQTETRARYPDQPPEKFVCIPNGFDPAAFAEFRPRPHVQPGFVVAYVGTVYSTTSPSHYLDALDRLPGELRAQVETRFIGRVADDQKPLLENRGSKVTLLGFMPQRSALAQMEEADYLLLTMEDPTAATGKMYEYLATGKPILAIAPVEGEIGQVMRETRAGWCVDPHDRQGIVDLLTRAFEPGGALRASFRPDQAAIAAYERPRLARAFADLMRP